MGSLPIITDNKLHSHPETEHQVKYYSWAANSALTDSVCVCVCAWACVDTSQALTNGADNETSPLIKRSHTEQCTLGKRWTHTNTHRHMHTHTRTTNVRQWHTSMNETELWSKQFHFKQAIWVHPYTLCVCTLCVCTRVTCACECVRNSIPVM